MIFKKEKKRKKSIKQNKRILFDSKSKKKYKKRKKKYILTLISKINIKFSPNNLYYYYLFGTCLILWIILFIIFWSVFKVKKINIFRNDSITNVNIAYRAIDSIRWKNIFSLEKTEISNLIKNYQKNVKYINVNKKLPNTLNINIWSYKEVFNTDYNWKNYIVVKNWTFIPNKFNKELIKVNIVRKNKTNLIPDYKIIIKKDFVQKIEELFNKLKNNLLSIKIKNIYLYETERNVIIMLDNWTKLLFNINTDIKNQIANLMVLNQEYFNINKKKVVYIDLRINNKIFICPLENEYQCKINLKRIYPYEN